MEVTEEDGVELPAAASASKPAGSSAAMEAASNTSNMFCDAIVAKANNRGGRGGKGADKKSNAKIDHRQAS